MLRFVGVSLTHLLLLFVALTVAVAVLTAAVVFTVRMVRRFSHGRGPKFA